MTTLVRHDLTDPAIPEGMVRIVLGSSHRFIWPVHLGGWQSLGWQLQPAAGLSAAEPRLPEPQTAALSPQKPDLEQAAELNPDSDAEADQAPEAQPQSAVVEPLEPVAPLGADSQSASLGAESQSAPIGVTPVAAGTDFQAMTKAQILEHCSSVYGVELDGSQTKAELVEQATALEIQAITSSASAEPLTDGLLDLDGPPI